MRKCGVERVDSRNEHDATSLRSGWMLYQGFARMSGVRKFTCWGGTCENLHMLPVCHAGNMLIFFDLFDGLEIEVSRTFVRNLQKTLMGAANAVCRAKKLDR